MPDVRSVRAVQPVGRRSDSAGALLRTLLRQGPSPRSTLARLSGLSPASVTGHSSELLERGLVTELPETVARGGLGRPYVPLDLNTSGTVVGGVHVAVEESTVALLDLRGAVVVERVIPHNGTGDSAGTGGTGRRSGAGAGLGAGAETILRRAADALAELLAAHADHDRLLGIGVATGGWVDRDAGTVVEHPMLGWRDVAAAAVFRARFGGTPVHVDSHIRALIRAEQLFGRLDPGQSVLGLFVGNVVDAAFALGDHVNCGPQSAAGGIAHWLVAGSSDPCICGRTGCLQATVTERRLVERAVDAGLLAGGSIDDVMRLAEDGDAGARALFRDRAAVLGKAVGPLVDFLNPEVVVVVEPGVVRFGEALTALRTAMERDSTPRGRGPAVVATSFRRAPLAVAAGAVALDVLYRDPLAVAPRTTAGARP